MPGSPPRAIVVVELDGGDGVSGWACRDDGERIRFEGLLGFFALFERLRTDEPAQGVRDLGPGAG